MKIFYKLIAFFLVIGLTSCNYLDIVPDERPTEDDAFKDQKAAERYMYSCYSYIPNLRDGTSSMDLFTGDEVVTAFEHESFASFNKGNYNPSNPLINYWDTLFKGIRQCYILKANIANVPGLDPAISEDYVNQADFLIGFFHYLLVRTYGPTILLKELPDQNTSAADFLGRTPYDDCVNWICDIFDKVSAEGKLPAVRKGNQYGLATSTAAKAIKSRLLLYAASPLFNGNKEFYADFKNPDGTPLMNTVYDAKKWDRAATAALEAIKFAEANGFALYEAAEGGLVNMPEPADLTQRSLRFNFIDKNNTKEVIWAETRTEGQYGLQNKSMPFWKGSTWNGVAPSITMVERFYTKNGLPIDEDPAYQYNERYEVASFSEDDANGEGVSLGINMNREPRYYAWVSFHNGYYECLGDNSDANSPYLKSNKRGVDGAKLLTQFTINANCGIQGRSSNYSPTGFLNKKGVTPEATSTGTTKNAINFPWPVVRLAELYLEYAEACVESGNLKDAKIYLNKVRKRAGVPAVETAWNGVATLDKAKLRQIVRQERLIELYLENHNFWDIRRWKEGAKYFTQKPRGLSINASTLFEFSKVVEVQVTRNFSSPGQYLMPIPIGEVNKNAKLVNNPGY